VTRHISSKQPPESLRRRGITVAVELAPFPGDFRVRDAGSQLATLFGDELRQRLAARSATRNQEPAA
jgi:hypothetical protein